MNIEIKSGIELSKGMKVYFVGEKLPMEVKAADKNYAICTRKLNRRHDADLLHHKVKMGDYLSFMDAYYFLKEEMVYTIVDFKNNLRGPDNFGGWCDYKDEKEIKKLLSLLNKGKVELSRRNQVKYNLDFDRTLINN
jgi:hypothetical protein